MTDVGEIQPAQSPRLLHSHLRLSKTVPINPTMNLLAERLIEYRKRRDEMSQYQLARLSGISRKHVNDLESGRKKDCKISTIKKLADALNVNPKRLLGWEEIEPDLIELGEITARELRRQVDLLAKARVAEALLLNGRGHK